MRVTARSLVCLWWTSRARDTCLQMELRRLEDAVTEVYEEMLYMRTREEEMRDTNGEWGDHTTPRHITLGVWTCI